MNNNIITDNEYDVLCEIRNNNGTSHERLKMTYFNDTDHVLKTLEDFALIYCETNAGRVYYYATDAGKEYIHKELNTPVAKINSHKTLRERFSNLKPAYKVLCAICAFVVGVATVIACVFTILSYYK